MILSPTCATPSRGADGGLQPVACAHCGAEVPSGLIRAGTETSFCCCGCELAYQMIHEHGLSAFYEMTRCGARPRDASSELCFSEYDSPEFLSEFAHKEAGGRWRITLALSGIHCVACVWLLEKLPQVLDGVESLAVNWSARTAIVIWQAQRVELSAIARALHGLGYTPQPFRENRQRDREVTENRRHLIRLAVAGAAAGNNMLIALALYLGWFAGMDPAIEFLLRWASCLVGLISLLWPGCVFFHSAWSAWKMRVPHMDLPIALGLAVGGISGLVNTLRGVGEIYFDSLSVLVFLLLVGRYVQYRQQRRAADAIDLLHRLTPRQARKIVNGREVVTRAELLQVGDVVEVHAGETIPADGQLSSSRAVVDESLLTGESIPQERTATEMLAAGTLNLANAIRLTVTAVGQNTRVGRLMQLVEHGAGARPQIVQWANRIGGYFVVVVLALALLTVAWWLPVNCGLAIDHATALLIVACPCALAMATPLAIAVALGRAAQRGILIRGGDVLQRLHRPGVIWLDKTGTLTQGHMRVAAWFGDEKALMLAAAVERHSAHPIARAVVAAADDRALSMADTYEAMDVQQSSSGGITGMVRGQRVVIGNANFVAQYNAQEKQPSQDKFAESVWQLHEQAILLQGLSPMYVMVDNVLVGLAGVGDPLRDDAAKAIDTLQFMGWQVGILSGDHPRIVEAVARQLNIDANKVLGGIVPEQKVRIITQSQRQTPKGCGVVMVGDGVNDSAALAAASVGIAVHGGSEVSLQAAPVYLNRPGLDGLLELLEGSRRTMRTIRRNLIVSLAYNALGATLAITGVINPLVAAVLMPISSLTVVSLSLAGGGFRMRQ